MLFVHLKTLIHCPWQISRPQEPFDLESMPEYFWEELTADGEESQVDTLNHCLRVLDLDKLLGTLYEFLETYVKHSPPNEKEWPYVLYFDYYFLHGKLISARLSKFYTTCDLGCVFVCKSVP